MSSAPNFAGVLSDYRAARQAEEDRADIDRGYCLLDDEPDDEPELVEREYLPAYELPDARDLDWWLGKEQAE